MSSYYYEMLVVWITRHMMDQAARFHTIYTDNQMKLMELQSQIRLREDVAYTVTGFLLSAAIISVTACAFVWVTKHIDE